jgi:hypothetical protein
VPQHTKAVKSRGSISFFLADISGILKPDRKLLSVHTKNYVEGSIIYAYMPYISYKVEGSIQNNACKAEHLPYRPFLLHRRRTYAVFI